MRNPQEVLREEILAGARRQAEETLSRARADAEALLVKAKADAEKEHRDKIAVGQGRGRPPWPSRSWRRCRSTSAACGPPAIESLLQAVHDEARRRILAREGFDYREALVTLAAEAVGRMEGDRFVLAVSEADRKALGDGWLEDVRRRAGRDGLELSLAAEPARIAGGVVVRDADGRQLWDDRPRGAAGAALAGGAPRNRRPVRGSFEQRGTRGEVDDCFSRDAQAPDRHPRQRADRDRHRHARGPDVRGRAGRRTGPHRRGRPPRRRPRHDPGL